MMPCAPRERLRREAEDRADGSRRRRIGTRASQRGCGRTDGPDGSRTCPARGEQGRLRPRPWSGCERKCTARGSQAAGRALPEVTFLETALEEVLTAAGWGRAPQTGDKAPSPNTGRPRVGGLKAPGSGKREESTRGPLHPAVAVNLPPLPRARLQGPPRLRNAAARGQVGSGPRSRLSIPVTSALPPARSGPCAQARTLQRPCLPPCVRRRR